MHVYKIKPYLLIHDKFCRIKGEFALKVHFNEDETWKWVVYEILSGIQRRVYKPKLMIVSNFRDARVVKDMATGKSKGYGFVSFFNKWVSSIKSACAMLWE